VEYEPSVLCTYIKSCIDFVEMWSHLSLATLAKLPFIYSCKGYCNYG